MNARDLARQLAVGRVALGAGLIAAPGLLTRPWLGAVGATAGARVLSAGFGARDVAIGAGALRALAGGGAAREWLLAGALADTADLAATLAARRTLPAFGVISVG